MVERYKKTQHVLLSHVAKQYALSTLVCNDKLIYIYMELQR